MRIPYAAGFMGDGVGGERGGGRGVWIHHLIIFSSSSSLAFFSEGLGS